MPTPTYITDLRTVYGQGLLLLPGVCGVIVRGAGGAEEVLLVRRSDNGRWTLPSGIVEPGEQPAVSLVREVMEETGVTVRAERLALLVMDEPTSYPNGDLCQFLTMVFRCTYLDGVARVGDEESSAVQWYPLTGLPALDGRQLDRLRAALRDQPATDFVR